MMRIRNSRAVDNESMERLKEMQTEIVDGMIKDSRGKLNKMIVVLEKFTATTTKCH